MLPKCLIATTFIGLEKQLARLQERFDCRYEPDVVLPCGGFADTEILIVNPNNLNWSLDVNTLQELKSLKYILTISTGIAHIDLDYVNDRGIQLVSLKDSTNEMHDITATAELAFLFFLAKSRNFQHAASPDSLQRWDWRESLGYQLREQAVGILGMGRLGKLFDRYCNSFGCSTRWYDPNVGGGANNIEEIIQHSDVLSVHANYYPGMKPLIDGDLLKLAKPSIHIINTARGELIDEDALVDFLDRNNSAHYSADVLSNEQNRQNNVLYKYSKHSSNVTLTPHVGGMTVGSRELAYKLALNKFFNFMES